MKRTMTEYDFIEAFQNSDTRKEQFTIPALEALFNYYEEYEQESEKDIEFDMISICCEWVEYDSFEQLQNDYSSIETFEQLQDRTTVIECSNSHILIVNF